jgi:hypothetical protein
MRTTGAGACLLAALLLTGCAGRTPGTPSTPAASAGSPPAAGSEPAASPSTAPTPSAAAAGCSTSTGTIPAGAATATIPDVDGDGKPDVEYYSERTSPFTYGIRTAAGGLFPLADDLAGPGVHSGWTAPISGPVGHVTVLDDGREASLHAWIGCRFVTPTGPDGKPYRFGLNGFSQYGTGVTCESSGGSTHLAGVLAKRRSDGRYDIILTRIEISADGTRATNGTISTRWRGLAASDPRVAAARTSSCDGAPEVRTSGE